MGIKKVIEIINKKFSKYWSVEEKDIRLMSKVVRGRENYKYVDLDNYKLTFLLLLTTLASFFIFYYTYADYKYNIYKNIIELKPVEPLNIDIDSPIGLDIPNDYESKRYIFKDKDNILSVLINEINVNKNDAYNCITSLGKFYNFKNIRSGQEIFVKYKNNIDVKNSNDVAKTVIPIELKIFDDAKLEEYTVVREEKGKYSTYKNKISLIPYYNRYIVNISSNIYTDAIKAGIPVEVINNMISHYSFDIDFQRDIKYHDWFEIVYESFYTDSGKVAKNGDIIYANLHVNGNDHRIYKFNYNNVYEYFDENGLSTKKSLLKTPIDGARITSGFGNRRKHPVLGYTKAHKGIDFAAPVGTPFYASGNGVVKKIVTGCVAGDQSCGRGYGNYILIQHNSSYSTEYAHLLNVNKNIRIGSRVKQGQIIGFVGNTGLSTGSHLHYGIIYKNERINPNRVRSISSTKLAGNNLIKFIDEKNKIDQLRSSAVNQTFSKKFSKVGN